MLPGMETAGLLAKGQCESPLALVWGPGIPRGLLILFSFSGLELVQPCWQLRRAELRLLTQCLGQNSPESRSMALHGTPQCPMPVPGLHQGCGRVIVPPFLLSVCAVALWPGQRCREGDAAGPEGLMVPLSPHQCKLEAPWLGGAESRTSLCLWCGMFSTHSSFSNSDC